MRCSHYGSQRQTGRGCEWLFGVCHTFPLTSVTSELIEVTVVLWIKDFHHAHFTNEKTKAQRYKTYFFMS